MIDRFVLYLSSALINLSIDMIKEKNKFKKVQIENVIIPIHTESNYNEYITSIYQILNKDDADLIMDYVEYNTYSKIAQHYIDNKNNKSTKSTLSKKIERNIKRIQSILIEELKVS